MKKDMNIQVLRIFSMIMILCCHFFNEMQNKIGNIMGQFFNVGVFIFLIISGYLFGKKKIDNIKSWYLRRAIRIFIPLWIWTFIVNILYLIFNKTNFISIKSIISYTFNLQGFFGATQGLEHLWFLTIIMICYLITPLLQYFRNKKPQYILIALFAISIGISFINTKIGRYVFLVLLYSLTYYYSYWNKNIFKIKNTVIAIIIILAMIVRILGNVYLDNTVIYTNFIVLITQTIIAICIFIWSKKIKLCIENKKILKIIDKLDEISLYVYIVHYIFCVGPIDIIDGFENKYYLIEVISTIIISIILAYILCKVCNLIVKYFRIGKKV